MVLDLSGLPNGVERVSFVINSMAVWRREALDRARFVRHLGCQGEADCVQARQGILPHRDDELRLHDMELAGEPRMRLLLVGARELAGKHARTFVVVLAPDQFQRFAGEEARLALKLPQDGRRKLQGRILRVDGDDIVLQVEGAEWAVPMENIEKARLVPDWAALGLAPARKPGRKQ